MKNKKILLLLTAVFALVLVAASLLYTRLGADFEREVLATQETPEPTPEETAGDEAAEETETQPPERMLAMDFTVYDLEGNPVNLTDFRGKPVVLNFWASWCGPCKMEMPDFQEKYLEYEDEIQFMMVNLTDGSRETLESASGFLEEQTYTFPVFYDTASMAAMVYGVYSIPTTYFIDSEGYLVAYASSAINAEVLQTGIDMIY